MCLPISRRLLNSRQVLAITLRYSLYFSSSLVGVMVIVAKIKIFVQRYNSILKLTKGNVLSGVGNYRNVLSNLRLYAKFYDGKIYGYKKSVVTGTEPKIFFNFESAQNFTLLALFRIALSR